MSTHSLQDMSNYKEHFNRNTTEIFARYTTLILEYLFRCSEALETKNTDYFKYIYTYFKCYKYYYNSSTSYHR